MRNFKYELTHLLVAQVQELVKLNPTVGERTERPLLLELGGEGGVGNFGIGLQKSHKADRQHFALYRVDVSRSAAA